jgi:hypothetical protein
VTFKELTLEGLFEDGWDLAEDGSFLFVPEASFCFVDLELFVLLFSVVPPIENGDFSAFARIAGLVEPSKGVDEAEFPLGDSVSAGAFPPRFLEEPLTTLLTLATFSVLVVIPWGTPSEATVALWITPKIKSLCRYTELEGKKINTCDKFEINTTYPYRQEAHRQLSPFLSLITLHSKTAKNNPNIYPFLQEAELHWACFSFQVHQLWHIVLLTIDC